MKVQIAFGKRGLELELPDGPDYHVVKVHSAPPLPDVEKALAAALDAPVAGLPLIELARGKKSAAISVCDITRPAPNPITLPPCWNGCIVPAFAPENVTICIATGPASRRDGRRAADHPWAEDCGDLRYRESRRQRSGAASLCRHDAAGNPGLY